MTQNGIFFHGPHRENGFYLVPTLQFWRNDFRKIDPSFYLSYGIAFKIFFWYVGVTINMYGKNGKNS